MAGKTTDRKGKLKDTKSVANEPLDMLATFTLPDSLPCSEIEFPIVEKKPPRANWKEIIEESDREFLELQAYTDSKTEPVPKSPFLKTECDYIKNEVFVYLIPALEETLNKAKIWEALNRQKCFFNGIDHIVQLLWNNNPRYPDRIISNRHIFNMPWVRRYLAEKYDAHFRSDPFFSNYSYKSRGDEESPRPYYPKSWLWPEEYAATLIQKTVRQYFVQREEDVQEMREFWKKLKKEHDLPELDTNPFLAKKFASS